MNDIAREQIEQVEIGLREAQEALRQEEAWHTVVSSPSWRDIEARMTDAIASKLADLEKRSPAEVVEMSRIQGAIAAFRFLIDLGSKSSARLSDASKRVADKRDLLEKLRLTWRS